MLHVLGEYPTKVYVMGGRNVPEIAEMNDYDYVAILFWFPSGTIGIIDVSRYSSFGYDQRMEVGIQYTYITHETYFVGIRNERFVKSR